jgi:hypothetical protein
MKLPGASWFYAFIMLVFGQSTAGIHTGLLLVNLLCCELVYRIARKTIGTTGAAGASAIFALLSIAPGGFGFAAHATHFNALCVLAGWAALLQYRENRKTVWLILSGVAFGLAFIVKQHAVFLLLFAFIAWWWYEKEVKTAISQRLARGGIFTAAMGAPYAAVLLVAAATGTFERMWHWTVEYASQYVGIVDAAEARKLLGDTLRQLIESVEWIWALGAAGLILLVIRPASRKTGQLLLLFFLLSLLCVTPGLYFRNHYFILFFPALALMAGQALQSLGAALQSKSPAMVAAVPLLLLAGAGYTFRSEKLFFFEGDPRMLCAMTYGTSNPFNESPEIAKFIAANTRSGDRVAVLGSEPQIYFYARRLSSSGYIYMYPLMEQQAYSAEMQRDMIAEIEKNPPKILVYVDSPFSWLQHPDAPQEVFRWYERYKSNYQLAGIVDMNPSRQATFVWRDQLKNYTGKGKQRIWIWERR